MKPIEVKKKIFKTVPLYLNTAITSSQKYGWMVCHGQGQRADRIIHKWSEFDPNEHRVVSLEASNRYYWEGLQEKDVAAWMTSRFRLEDIRDNNDYFDHIYNEYIAPCPLKILFGFSQGGTTMWRWIHDRRPEFDVFIDYAGWIPEDIDLSCLQSYLRDKKLVFAYGTKDHYIKEDTIIGLNKVIDRSKLDIILEAHDGIHKVDRSVLQLLAEKYIYSI